MIIPYKLNKQKISITPCPNPKIDYMVGGMACRHCDDFVEYLHDYKEIKCKYVGEVKAPTVDVKLTSNEHEILCTMLDLCEEEWQALRNKYMDRTGEEIFDEHYDSLKNKLMEV